jgi:hypothetical protein
MKACEAGVHRFFAQAKTPAVTTISQVRGNPPRLHVTVDRVRRFPISLALDASEAINSFRAALDYLVYELSFMDTRGVEKERTAFPASTSPKNFRSNYVQGVLLDGLTTRHRAMIKRFQPYQRRKNDPPHPIALLDDLSNDNKHRLLQPALMTPQAYEFRFEGDGVGQNCHIIGGDYTFYPTFGVALEPKTELLEIPVAVTGPDPKMDVYTEAQVQVCLRNGVPLDWALVNIAAYSRAIVEVFAPEFERPCALRLRDKPRYGRFRPNPPTQMGLSISASEPVTITPPSP